MTAHLLRHNSPRILATKNRRFLKKSLLTVLLLVTISLLCVKSRIAVVQLGYRIHDLTNELAGVEEGYQALKLELATRKSLDRLTLVAGRQLGLKEPEPGQMVILKKRGEPVRLSANSRDR